MKVSTVSLAFAMLATAWQSAHAEPKWEIGLRQPASISPVAYESYYAQPPAIESPSDLPPEEEAMPEAPAAAPAPVMGGAPSCTTGCSTCTSGCDACDSCSMGCDSCSTGCDSCTSGCDACSSCCGCDCGCDPCDHGDPWTLFEESCCGIVAGGWIQGGMYENAHGAPDNGPLGFNNITGFNLHQLWGFVAKEAESTDCKPIDFGFRVDYIYGADGADTQAFGDQEWDFGWDSSTDYGSAIPQIYAEVAIGDLKIKAGHFYTIIGWEVVTAPDNFFFSHAYCQYYGEPFTHTGALAEYALNDQITILGGWTGGWDSAFDNVDNGSTFLGGVFLTLSDDLNFYWAVNAGRWGNGNPSNNGDIYNNSFVVEASLTDKLTYILQHDFTINSDLPGTNLDNEWYGINQYLQYEVNGCLSLGARFEWFRDDDGVRVTSDNFGGAAGDYYELTLGMNIRPHANIVFRPEIRWDWYDGATDGGGNLPYDGGTQDDQFAGGFDVIFTF